MSALLVWSMRFVDDFSSDILRAKQRRADMDANIRQRRRDGDLERWNRYLDSLRRAGEPLPGHILSNGNTGLAVNYLAATLDVSLSTIHMPPVRATSRSALAPPWMSRSGDRSKASSGWQRSITTRSTPGCGASPPPAPW